MTSGTASHEAQTGQPGQAANSSGTPVTRKKVLPGHDTLRTTRYSDVCGGTDEFKRLLTEDAAQSGTPEGRAALRHLLDDGLYMLARMEVRLRAYQGLRDDLARVAARMTQFEEPRLTDAHAEAEKVRTLLAAGVDAGHALPADELVERAEEIRQVANDMEGALRRHKEAALEAVRSLEAVLGRQLGTSAASGAGAGSNGSEGADTRKQPVPAWIPEAWLPPAPHKEKIVDWLTRSRATLLSNEEAAALPDGPHGQEPWVQFEDGGVMPLRVVRWDDGVSNFHPMGSTPHPRGKLYRNREAGPQQPPE